MHSICGKDLTLIAARWNIVQQNKSNRRLTADRVRDDRANRMRANPRIAGDRWMRVAAAST
jgi:hypothetical protein